MIKDINTEELLSQIDSKETILVDFHATWCMPCKMMTGVLEKVDETLEGKLPILKVDIDENLDIAKEHDVLTVPTLMVFKNGEMVERIVGFRQEQQLIDIVSKYM